MTQETKTKGSDLEASTFQKRPCYRYIRKADKLPVDTHDEEIVMARVKLFNPTGAGTWYIASYDPETRSAFGRAVVQESEIGYIDIAELVDFRGRFDLPIERDLWWEPRPLSECS